MNINHTNNQAFMGKYSVSFDDKNDMKKFKDIYKKNVNERGDYVTFRERPEENKLFIITGQDGKDYDQLGTASFSVTLDKSNLHDQFLSDAKELDLRA